VLALAVRIRNNNFTPDTTSQVFLPMPQDVKCPKCAHLFPVTEVRQAFTVECPKCDADMTVEFKKPATPPDAGQAPYDVVVKPGTLPEAAAGLKAPRKRSDDDDTESTSGGGGGSVLIVVFSGVLGLLFVIGGLGATGWVLFTQIDTGTASGGSGNRNNNNAGNNSPGNNNKDNTNRGNTGGETAPPLPAKKDAGFELRPTSGGGSTITPPPLTDNVTPLDLPGRAGQITAGGGGKYIVVHFPDKGQLGVLDITTAVSQFVEADRGDGVRIAAGQSRVVLFSPDTNMMQVFSLPDLKKLAGTPFPMSNCKSIAMGSRTNGPMLAVSASGEVVLADVTDGGVKVIEGSSDKPGVNSNNLRAAPDGTAFATFDGFANNNKVKLLTEVNRKWKVTNTEQVPFPGGDGNFYGNGRALSRTNGSVVPGSAGTWYVPAISGIGGDFVKLSASNTTKGKRVALTFHAGRNPDAPVPGSPTMIGPEVDNLMDARGNVPPDKALDQYLFYSPEAKLLVLLAGSRTRFVLRKTDTN